MRYDALLHLVGKWNRATTVDQLAAALASAVKYVISLDAWRFVLVEDGATAPGTTLLVQGTLTSTGAAEATLDALSPLERGLLEVGAPVLLEDDLLESQRDELPEPMRSPSIRQIYACASLGPTSTVRHVFVVASATKSLALLDRKFTGLLGDLFADRLRRLRGEERLREAHLRLAQQARRLDDANRQMRLVLDHVEQGLVSMDRRGVLGSEWSRAFERWFGPPVPGSSLAAHLAPYAPTFAAMLSLGVEALTEATLPPEVVVDQWPTQFAVDGRPFRVSYIPIGAPVPHDRFLVVTSDAQKDVACEALARDQRELMALFQHGARDRAVFHELVHEVSELVASLVLGASTAVEERRLLHTVKGNCALFGLESMVDLCHSLEDALATDERRLSPGERESVRLTWARVAERVRILGGGHGQGAVEVAEAELERAISLVEAEPSVAAQILAGMRRDRITPRVERLAEHARALARRLGVDGLDVRVRVPGAKGAAPPPMALWPQLVHLVRNAIDHGVRERGRRAANEAPPRLDIEAAVERGSFLLVVADNGDGIDWEGVRERARQKGLPHATQAELTEALFTSGLTTRSVASDVSGRGEGLSSLHRVVRDLGGTLEVESTPGRGTTFRVRVPAAVDAA